MGVEKSKLLADLNCWKKLEKITRIESAADQKAPVCRSAGADACFLAINKIQKHITI